jgi:hypothetical protein|mmetsp:Transcript_40498/g.65759  ORF Transcript_40498/g.65759 Transcript_40498/m.65759 type:complete len:80 (+) Transcript_40498:1849-2088(+)
MCTKDGHVWTNLSTPGLVSVIEPSPSGLNSYIFWYQSSSQNFADDDSGSLRPQPIQMTVLLRQCLSIEHTVAPTFHAMA